GGTPGRPPVPRLRPRLHPGVLRISPREPPDRARPLPDPVRRPGGRRGGERTAAGPDDVAHELGRGGLGADTKKMNSGEWPLPALSPGAPATPPAPAPSAAPTPAPKPVSPPPAI